MWMLIKHKKPMAGCLSLVKRVCAGACVSFYARTKHCVTPSSAEAEYMVMATGFARQFASGISGLMFLWTAGLGVPR